MIVFVFLLLAELCSLCICSFVCYTMPWMCKIYALTKHSTADLYQDIWRLFPLLNRMVYWQKSHCKLCLHGNQDSGICGFNGFEWIYETRGFGGLDNFLEVASFKLCLDRVTLSMVQCGAPKCYVGGFITQSNYSYNYHKP